MKKFLMSCALFCTTGLFAASGDAMTGPESLTLSVHIPSEGNIVVQGHIGEVLDDTLTDSADYTGSNFAVVRVKHTLSNGGAASVKIYAASAAYMDTAEPAFLATSNEPDNTDTIKFTITSNKDTDGTSTPGSLANYTNADTILTGLTSGTSYTVHLSANFVTGTLSGKSGTFTSSMYLKMFED